MYDRARLKPQMRKDQILEAAVELAKEYGYQNFTRDQVAEVVGVTAPLISVYYPMTKLRHAVLRHATNNRIPEIIAQYIVSPGDFIGIIITNEHQQIAADYVRNNNAQNTEGV